MTPELLRKMAQRLREEDAQEHAVRRAKTANLFRAATGLGLLRRSLGGAHVD